MSSMQHFIGKAVVEEARRQGFELYFLPGQGQVRVRHIGQFTHQPTDGSLEGDKAKAAAEQYSGEMRTPSGPLLADINNKRREILMYLGFNQRVQAPAHIPVDKVPNVPGFGDGEQT